MSERTITASILPDGRVRETLPDGTVRIVEIEPIAPMSHDEIERIAAEDDENPPVTAEDRRLGRVLAVPRVKSLRTTMGLTQEAFAARFGIPLGTLRDWEQGRVEPDKLACAYLKVITREPDAVVRALGSDKLAAE